jgi:DNA-binding beta-propeller fold protein YncE
VVLQPGRIAKEKKMERMKRLGGIIFFLIIFALPGIFTPDIFAADEFVFEQMWPQQTHSWFFSAPYDLAMDASGNIYVANAGNDRIQKFSPSGDFITSWGGYGLDNGNFDYPTGIALDAAGNVYVVDRGNNRVQKFTSSGDFITKWGGTGSGSGAFDEPCGIAVDSGGNVYVVDRVNCRVQKFDASGNFISKWGSSGSGNGQFDQPFGIAVDPSGNFYVTDSGNHRVQKFSPSGGFIAKWGTEGDAEREFDNPSGIALDAQGNVYVSDWGNSCIQKFNSSGGFIAKWGDEGHDPGELFHPIGMMIDQKGDLCVADTINHRIQKFNLSGKYLTKWGSEGSGNGAFNSPFGVASDSGGNVYVADYRNHRIQKFSASGDFLGKWDIRDAAGQLSFPLGMVIDGSDNIYVTDENHCVQKFNTSGTLLTRWGSSGTGDGQFSGPVGIAMDGAGSIYVVDSGNHRVQKFTSGGQFVTKWGSEGTGDGQFNNPKGIATDGSNNVYVVDYDNSRVQKFTSSGTFITKWGGNGSGDGKFDFPYGIATTALGEVYVTDAGYHRIQKFTSGGVFVSKFGGTGSGPGLFNMPSYLFLSPSGKMYVSDTYNNRIQVLSAPPAQDVVRKAVIVAGSGNYDGNELWLATQMCANYAYSALVYQGYGRDSIYYLSEDTDLDLNNDGRIDVDSDATNANLAYAIQTWAANADNLFIYMVGHGGSGNFRMSQYELLSASDLDVWLDAAQQTVNDFVAVVYDGCRSGSFLPYLSPPAGKTRVVAASAATDEAAIFKADGGVSFGYQFFSKLFGGGSFYDSFNHGKKSIEGVYDFKQNPQIEGNGDGVGNQKNDKEIAAAIKLGRELMTANDIPAIQSVSSPQTLSEGETSAVISAQNVVDADGISTVFAVITPPGYSSGSAENPITDLPTIDLTDIGGNTYSGFYSGFSEEGVYNVAVFARDGQNALSLPVQTTVTVPVTSDCLTVASDLSIHVPCAYYNGSASEFTLDFYRNPDDPRGYYWKLVLASLMPGEGTNCIPAGTDQSMSLSCVSYNGYQYAFTLRFYYNPYNPSGQYWKMDMGTLQVKNPSPINSGGFEDER